LRQLNCDKALKKTISIIGGGASALAFSAFIDTNKYEVVLFDKNKALARKFLVAGDGGFNLTHGSVMDEMLNHYEPKGFLDEALLAFTNEDFRKWLKELGIETYVGSSGRVFPLKPIKPIEVLQAILNLLKKKGIHIKTNMEWTAWNTNNSIELNNSDVIKTDIVVFALGGSSWKVTGSDGNWLRFFESKQIPTQAFEASNCAFKLNWPEEFIKNHAGKSLKNIALSSSNKTYKGEVTVSEFGLEGNAIYPLSTEIKKQIKSNGQALINIDFKPMLTDQEVFNKLLNSKAKNSNEKLKLDLKLSSTAIQIIKNNLSKEAYLDNLTMAKAIKRLPLIAIAPATIDEAISTTGGISLEAIDVHYELKQLKNHYCIGEMLDWNAPTGGYLLQACFSMGVNLAKYLNTK
jgi:uncharacterized flavoprotein (TIGR03862 family)